MGGVSCWSDSAAWPELGVSGYRGRPPRNEDVSGDETNDDADRVRPGFSRRDNVRPT